MIKQEDTGNLPCIKTRLTYLIGRHFRYWKNINLNDCIVKKSKIIKRNDTTFYNKINENYS